MSNDINLETNQEQVIIQEDEVDGFLRSASINGTRFVTLPKKDGESKIYQFPIEKSKRTLVSRPFVDPITKQETLAKKIRYLVIDPSSPDQGEKELDTPRTLAQQIEANIAKNHTLLEITKRGEGVNTRYYVIAA